VPAQDRYGKQMAMMSNSLASPKDLDDVIAYIRRSARAMTGLVASSSRLLRVGAHSRC
jgi:hypothetical protein